MTPPVSNARRRADALPMPHESYQDGLRDGRIAALETIAARQDTRLDRQGTRLRILERMMWALLGAMALVEFAPKAAGLIGQFM